MLFNSLEFFVFLAVVISLYFLISHKKQNILLLIASYLFYGWWDWRFLSLILLSTIVDYFCGLQIEKQVVAKNKKMLLSVSIGTNLLILGFFKYWDFFVDSFVQLSQRFGLHADPTTLGIILPVGISFYTFQTMTYSIDIYRGELKPTRDFLNFALFVSFFPQLVAGPIERAQALLPQIEQKRVFTRKQLTEGAHLIFWGLFKKVFVADNLAVIVNQIYGKPEATGLEYIVATWAFAFQIYGDFSGYSDIARGTARCLGINLMVNFRQPYFVTNPSEFWRHWHISLSSWLRDYLYIPLGGSRNGVSRTYQNLMITMLLGGLWHGAGWNYVIWGAYHGLILCGHRILKKGQEAVSRDNLVKYFGKAFVMFQLTCVSWIFFRATSFVQIKLIFTNILKFQSTTEVPDLLAKVLWFSALPLLVMFVERVKTLQPSIFESKRILLKLSSFHRHHILLKSSAYGFLAYLLCFYSAESQAFIYFQF